MACEVHQNGTCGESCQACHKPIFPGDVPIDRQPRFNPFEPPPDNQLPKFPLPGEPIGPEKPIYRQPILPLPKEPIIPPIYRLPILPIHGQPVGPQPIHTLPPGPTGEPVPQPPIQRYPILPPNKIPILPPIEPSQPIEPIPRLGPGPSGQPILPIPPTIPPPHYRPKRGDNPLSWLLFGGNDNLIIAQYTGTAGILGLLTLGGTELGLTAYLGPVALIAAAITATIFGLIEVFTGRPRLQATHNISRFADSPSPLLSSLGKAARNGILHNTPISTSNKAKWSELFGPDIWNAYNEMKKEYPSLTESQIIAAMNIIMQEMGNPQNHKPILITAILLDEVKKGTITIPPPSRSETVAVSPYKRFTKQREAQRAARISLTTAAMVRSQLLR